MLQKKQLPGQRDGEYIEDYIERSWQTEPGIKSEFDNDYDSFAAFCRAEAAGCVKIRTKVKGVTT